MTSVEWGFLEGVAQNNELYRDRFETVCREVRSWALQDWRTRFPRELRNGSPDWVHHLAHLWDIARRFAVSPDRTRDLYRITREQVTELVNTVYASENPGRTIASLLPAEFVVRDMAREVFAGQMVEVIRSIFADSD